MQFAEFTTSWQLSFFKHCYSLSVHVYMYVCVCVGVCVRFCWEDACVMLCCLATQIHAAQL